MIQIGGKSLMAGKINGKTLLSIWLGNKKIWPENVAPPTKDYREYFVGVNFKLIEMVMNSPAGAGWLYNNKGRYNPEGFDPMLMKLGLKARVGWNLVDDPYHDGFKTYYNWFDIYPTWYTPTNMADNYLNGDGRDVRLYAQFTNQAYSEEKPTFIQSSIKIPNDLINNNEYYSGLDTAELISLDLYIEVPGELLYIPNEDNDSRAFNTYTYMYQTDVSGTNHNYPYYTVTYPYLSEYAASQLNTADALSNTYIYLPLYEHPSIYSEDPDSFGLSPIKDTIFTGVHKLNLASNYSYNCDSEHGVVINCVSITHHSFQTT